MEAEAAGRTFWFWCACVHLLLMAFVFLQDCFLTMSPAWYQSLIKVLLNRFPQSCRHFDDSGVQYLVRRARMPSPEPS